MFYGCTVARNFNNPAAEYNYTKIQKSYNQGEIEGKINNDHIKKIIKENKCSAYMTLWTTGTVFVIRKNK